MSPHQNARKIIIYRQLINPPSTSFLRDFDDAKSQFKLLDLWTSSIVSNSKKNTKLVKLDQFPSTGEKLESCLLSWVCYL
jgi:hypothetical protein